MMDFKRAVGILLSPTVEGGYSNNPNDPGGETRWGITRKKAIQHGYLGDMRIFPREYAEKIYLEEYWAPQRIDELPEIVRYCVFDSCVNEGVERTVEWMREILDLLGEGVDDQLITEAKVAELHLLCDLVAHRIRHYTSLGTWGMFGRGWANRIATNLEVVTNLV